MRTPVIEFDRLQMYIGDPYVIDIESANGIVTVYQPTIGEIISFGEDAFYNTLNIFISNTTSYRLALWEAGIDWNEISDFNLFCIIYKGIDKNASKLLFKDLDFSEFELLSMQYEDSNKIVPILYNEITQTVINEDVYNHFSQYLRNVFNMFPEEKITRDPVMKQWFINKDKRQLAINDEKKKKGKIENSSMQAIISACVNHPGFKYKLHELREIGVCEFYDSVKRLQVYENSTAMLKGLYSGFINGKGINPDSYNFMKNI